MYNHDFHWSRFLQEVQTATQLRVPCCGGLQSPCFASFILTASPSMISCKRSSRFASRSLYSCAREAVFGRVARAALPRVANFMDSELVLSPLDGYCLWCSWRYCGGCWYTFSSSTSSCSRCLCKCPWPLRRSMGNGNGGRFVRSPYPFLTQYTRHGPWSLYSCSPWSSRPQPLGSGGDATPCEDPRKELGPHL